MLIHQNDSKEIVKSNSITLCLTVDPHMGLVFFICCSSRFWPSGGLLKSQMLLPGWVVNEPGSGLEMQWGGDTC